MLEEGWDESREERRKAARYRLQPSCVTAAESA